MRVAGVDLGTSSVKAVLFDIEDAASASRELARVVEARELRVPLVVDTEGRAEQDADVVLEAARACLEGWSGVLVGLSGAMHSLLPLDAKGVPLSPALTWADTRASRQAARLRAETPDVGVRTGTPIHAMSPLCKLAWMREESRTLFDRTARFTGLKEYVLQQLCGFDAMDRGMACGTGMYDVASGDWDTRLVRELEVAGRLPRIVETTHRVADFVVGGADGPLGNVGCGAVREDVACVSVGTSGAVRVPTPEPLLDPSGRAFCYHAAPGLWVRGGAISSGGVVLTWLSERLGLGTVEEVARLAETVPAGADGVLLLPQLSGERTPYWDETLSGALLGLRLAHGQAHIARAGMEGVCFALRDALRCVPGADGVREIRATGGFTRSRLMLQICADVLELPVSVPATAQSSALGAALVAVSAVTGRPVVDLASGVAAAETLEPRDREVYRTAFERYRRAIAQLRLL